MIDAAERASALVAGIDVATLTADRQRTEALLWNFTVLGEAAAQLDAAVKERFSDVEWFRPSNLRDRIVHGYWSIDLEVLHAHRGQRSAGLRRAASRRLSQLEAEDDA